MQKGSLRERYGNYYAVFRVNGKQKWVNLEIPVTEENKQMAYLAMQKEIYKQTTGEGCNDNILFEDFLDVWLNDIKAFVKPSTWEGYSKVVNGKIKPNFKDKRYRLRDLKPIQFNRFFVHLQLYGNSRDGGGLRKKAVKNIKGVLSSVFSYAEDNDFIESNIIRKTKLPKFDGEPEFEPTIYEIGQINELLNYARVTESKATLFLYLVVFTGARKGELLGLTWDNVDFDNNTIHIKYNRTGSKKETVYTVTTPKSKKSIRTIPVKQEIMDMLKAEKALQENNKKLLKSYYHTYDYDFVIRKADGSLYNPNSINRIINKMIEKLGLPHCRIHDFREMAATILDSQGVSLSDIATFLGHADTRTTERIYIKRSNTAKKEVVDKLNQLFDVF